MGFNRKRKRERDKPLKEGIPISKLGAEFEWIDERLKVGLEAYPTFKRPLGKAEMSMVLSLGLYYDDLTKKWQPLSAIDISTVRNQGRFYLVPPLALTADQWTDLRVDSAQRLLVYDSSITDTFRPNIIFGYIYNSESYTTVIESLGAAFSAVSIFIYNVVGTITSLQINNALPIDFYLNEYTESNVIADYKVYHRFTTPCSKIRFRIFAGAPGQCDFYIEFHKINSHQPTV